MAPCCSLCVQITAPVWAGGTQRVPTNGSVLLSLCVQITAPVWAGGTQRVPTNGSVLLSLCTDNGACLGWRDAEGPYQWLHYNEALLRARNFAAGLIASGEKTAAEREDPGEKYRR